MRDILAYLPLLEKEKKIVSAISRRGYEGNSKDGKVNYYLKLVEKCYLNLSFKPFPRMP